MSQPPQSMIKPGTFPVQHKKVVNAYTLRDKVYIGKDTWVFLLCSSRQLQKMIRIPKVILRKSSGKPDIAVFPIDGTQMVSKIQTGAQARVFYKLRWMIKKLDTDTLEIRRRNGIYLP